MVSQALWPHQQTGIDDSIQAIRDGAKAIVVAAPTGAGKTLMEATIAIRAEDKGKSVLVLTNRRVLINQLSDEFGKHGVPHGVIASGKKTNHFESVQLAMSQTVYSWAWDSDWMDKPTPDLMLVDEGHSHQAAQSQSIINHAISHGAIILYFTATPVGMGATCEALVQAGTYSGLQKQGILVPVDVYAPTEVDMEGLRKTKGEFSQVQMSKRVKDCGVIGDIYEHWEKLNPWKRATAVFAPDVATSKWIIKHVFGDQGISAWHIDGTTSEDERNECFAALNSGQLQVVSSCGVLREGWNAPIVQHAIMLQVCGWLKTYLQIVGRIMRAFPGKDHAVLQDHTGCWHRHGPPDMDRDWELNEDDVHAAEKRKQAIETGKTSEGIRCPKCSHTRYDWSKVCPKCKHEHVKSVRMMRQADGTLKKMYGQVVKIKKPPTAKEKWRRELFRGQKAHLTVGQCKVIYKKTYGEWPPEDEMTSSFNNKRKVEKVYPWVKRAVESRRKGAA